MLRVLATLVSTLLAASTLAQSNAVQGTDVNLYEIYGSTVHGRRGPSYPGGEVGVTFGHGFCNAGTVHVPWQTTSPGATMVDVHFKIAFMVARESNGRMVQVSTSETGVKHSRTTYNLGSSLCGTMIPGPSSTFYIGAYDAYNASYWNADRYNLGPSDEVNPWLGSWDPVGSYFDRGDPAVGGGAANDGRQSLTSSQTGAFDEVKNRVVIPEAELSQPGTFFAQVHLTCEGEPVANRGNNLRSERMSYNWNGSSWSSSNQGNEVAGSVLNQWQGANVSLGGNGNDDGRFAVGVVVTGPTNGIYHYEYAVHNVDNHRGGASFRLPLPPGANVTNAGFRDIDTNALNEWNISQNASEIAWTAAANNPLNWNSIYNFWFDCDAAPGGGTAVIDQARIGPGALDVSVSTEVPGGSPAATVAQFGNGCGSCTPAFYELFSPAANIDLSGSSAVMSYGGGEYNVGNGSTQYLAPASADLGLGNDDHVQVNLPFSLPYPGGSTNSLWVCSNGFVSTTAANGTGWLPIISSFLSGATRWAAGMHDLDPSTAGSVHFDASPTVATVTWLNVANFLSGSFPGTTTMQLQFYPNGDVHMIWQSMSNTGVPWVVGYTPGGVTVDPGSIDISSEVGNGFRLCMATVEELALDASAPPVVGSQLDQITSSISQPGTPFGATLMTITPPASPIDLSGFGLEGCSGYVPSSGSVTAFWTTGGNATVQVPFAVPNNNAFIGLEITSQSFAYTPAAGTSIGLIVSNGLLMTVGI